MSTGAQQPSNVLIAEDDDDDYVIFSLAIADTSIAVVLSRAEDGIALMNLLSERVPDILFLDLLMPGKDGRQCLREIRSNKNFDHLPIIVYSSLSDLETVEYCYREGSNLYAVKPASMEDLRVTLQRILTIDWKKTMYYPPRSEFVLGKSARG